MEKHRCEGHMWNGFGFSSCYRNGKIERDGKWYCGTHDPVARKIKNDAKRAKWQEEWNAREQADAAAKAAQQLIEAKAAMFDELVAACKLAFDENHCTPDCDKVLTAVLAKAKEIQNGQLAER